MTGRIHGDEGASVAENPLAQPTLEETAAFCVLVLDTLACVDPKGDRDGGVSLGLGLVLRTVIRALRAHPEVDRLVTALAEET